METMNRIFDEVENIMMSKNPDVHVEWFLGKKNNGVERHGITFHKEGSNVAPTLYVDLIAPEVESGMISAEAAARGLVEKALESMVDEIDSSVFDKWEIAKENLLLTLVSKSKNSARLDEIPYMDFVDDIVMTVREVVSIDGGRGSVQVTHALLQQWGKSKAELFDAAKAVSVKKYPAVTSDIFNMLVDLRRKEGKDLCEELGVTIEELKELFLRNEEIPMIVLTNEGGYFGASVIAYTDALAEVADRYDSNLYVIPSSTNEVIVIPCMYAEPKGLTEMIRSVNATEVPPEEVLSDKLYKYEYATGRLSVASTDEAEEQ